ncbi:phosphatidate cytidylyltransferase [Vagococcus coleopterorum]|uniref:Phosphatidate cytidylyltransferase n=1 Tax=Vagococcus coleopterorum TaxID=2714946 RepID=A0A6G8AMU4_9ENTE|nr:phosphatidate cytidylyltransferase [Vagococcus coleopterorum]QIL46401.1 phosphatidate cytidylyltransferase [Vagococcus coleopterorum]
MKQRVITAVVALALFIPILIFGGWAIELTAALLAAVGVYELFRMKGLEIKSLEGVVSIIGTVALVLPIAKYTGSFIDGLEIFYLMVMVLLSIAVFSKNTYTLEQAGFPVLVALYVGMGFKYFLVARGDTNSLVVLMFGLLVVWSTDIGAYLVGRQFGKNKLAPAISPNKTLEGSAGGILSAVVVATIYLLFFNVKEIFGYNFFMMIMFTIVLSMVGQLGDLVESAYKRHYGVKDSGKILPGHGGILDRFDSMLFVFPVMAILGII